MDKLCGLDFAPASPEAGPGRPDKRTHGFDGAIWVRTSRALARKVGSDYGRFHNVLAWKRTVNQRLMSFVRDGHAQQWLDDKLDVAVVLKPADKSFLERLLNVTELHPQLLRFQGFVSLASDEDGVYWFLINDSADFLNLTYAERLRRFRTPVLRVRECDSPEETTWWAAIKPTPENVIAHFRNSWAGLSEKLLDGICDWPPEYFLGKTLATLRPEMAKQVGRLVPSGPWTQSLSAETLRRIVEEQNPGRDPTRDYVVLLCSNLSFAQTEYLLRNAFSRFEDRRLIFAVVTPERLCRFLGALPWLATELYKQEYAVVLNDPERLATILFDARRLSMDVPRQLSFPLLLRADTRVVYPSVRELTIPDGARMRIVGRPGSGKTATMFHIAASATDRVILLLPPRIQRWEVVPAIVDQCEVRGQKTLIIVDDIERGLPVLPDSTAIRLLGWMDSAPQSTATLISYSATAKVRVEAECDMTGFQLVSLDEHSSGYCFDVSLAYASRYGHAPIGTRYDADLSDRSLRGLLLEQLRRADVPLSVNEEAQRALGQRLFENLLLTGTSPEISFIKLLRALDCADVPSIQTATLKLFMTDRYSGPFEEVVQRLQARQWQILAGLLRDVVLLRTVFPSKIDVFLQDSDPLEILCDFLSWLSTHHDAVEISDWTQLQIHVGQYLLNCGSGNSEVIGGYIAEARTELGNKITGFQEAARSLLQSDPAEDESAV